MEPSGCDRAKVIGKEVRVTHDESGVGEPDVDELLAVGRGATTVSGGPPYFR